MKKKESLYVAGLLLLLVLFFGGVGALFLNWVLSLFIDFPVTLGNWAKTWVVIIAIRLFWPSVRQ
jgi:hypothetical protein